MRRVPIRDLDQPSTLQHSQPSIPFNCCLDMIVIHKLLTLQTGAEISQYSTFVFGFDGLRWTVYDTTWNSGMEPRKKKKTKMKRGNG